MSPPTSAKSRSAKRLRAPRIVFLLKNLNIAPPPHGLEPNRYFVIQLLVQDIFSDRGSDLFQPGDWIHPSRLSFGNEHLVIVFANVFVGSAEKLSETQFEVARRPHSAQYGILKSLRANAIL